MPDNIKESKEKNAPQERGAEQVERLHYLLNANWGDELFQLF